MTEYSTYTFKVSYGDSDAAGVLYYARYLNLSEKARLEWMDSRGYPWKEWHFEKDVIFPVREVNIKYKKPFLLGDKGLIYTRLEELERYHLVIQQRFMNNKHELCALCKIKVVCLHKRRLVPVNTFFTVEEHG